MWGDVQGALLQPGKRSPLVLWVLIMRMLLGPQDFFFSCSIWLDSEFSDMLSSSFFPLPQTEGGYFVGFLCLPFLFQFSVCTAWCFKIAKEPSIYSDTQGKEIHRACCMYHSWCPKTPSWQTMSLPLNFPLCIW